METFTSWFMTLITGKVKSSAEGASNTMTGFADFLKAIGFSGAPVTLAQSGAATITAAAKSLEEASPELAAKAAAAAKVAAAELANRNTSGTQIALAPPANPAAPAGARPPATADRGHAA